MAAFGYDLMPLPPLPSQAPPVPPPDGGLRAILQALLQQQRGPGPEGIPTLTGRENQPAPPPPPEQDLPIGQIGREQQFRDAFGIDPNAPDFQRQVLGNFAQQAAPQVAGQAAFGFGRLLGPIAQAAPRATSSILAALGIAAPSAVGEAEAQQNRPQQNRPQQNRPAPLGVPTLAPAPPPPAVPSDPRTTRLQELDRLDAADRKALERLGTTNLQSKTARDNVSAPYLSAIETRRLERERIQNAMNEETERNRQAAIPTRERYADYMGYVPAVTGIASLLLGMGSRGRAQANFNQEIGDVSNRWGAAVNAANRGRPGPAQARQAETARGLGEEYRTLAAPEQGLRRVLTGGHGAGEGMASGAGIGIAGAFLPEEIDFARAVSGSPLWDSLRRTIIEDYPSTIKRAAIAGGLGATVGRIGGDLVSPLMSRPLPRGYGAATSALPPPRPPPGTGPVPPAPLGVPPVAGPAPGVPTGQAPPPPTTLTGAQPRPSPATDPSRPPPGSRWDPATNRWVTTVPGQGHRFVGGRDRWPDYIPPD